MDDARPRQSLPDDLADLIGLLFARGVDLALLCLVAQIGLAFIAAGLMSSALSTAGFLFAHSFFVMMLTDLGRRALDGGAPTLRAGLRTGFVDGIILMLPILLFWAPTQLAADVLIAIPGVPSVAIADLPWVVIGWVAITSLALPARIVARLRNRAFVALPAWQTALLMLPCLAVIELFGYPVQRCQGECWGLFEGGIVAFPLLGAHFFLASLTCALLSALTFRPPAG